eukprot:scaffold31444_cov24-Attheya_sp.AAC.1
MTLKRGSEQTSIERRKKKRDKEGPSGWTSQRDKKTERQRVPEKMNKTNKKLTIRRDDGTENE